MTRPSTAQYSAGPTVVRWQLADDRRSLTVVTRESNGIRTGEIVWDHDATDEEIMRALNPPALPAMQVGERRFARRWVLGSRTLWFHKMAGPPTWWWPRCFIHQRALVIGWLRRAIAVAVTRTAARDA